MGEKKATRRVQSWMPHASELAEDDKKRPRETGAAIDTINTTTVVNDVVACCGRVGGTFHVRKHSYEKHSLPVPLTPCPNKGVASKVLGSRKYLAVHVAP